MTDVSKPDACALLVSLDPYSPLIEEVAYSARDLDYGFYRAVRIAEDQGTDIPTCTCGNCPPILEQSPPINHDT